MTKTVLSIAQVRRWTNPAPWMIGGYSNTQEVFYLSDADRMVQVNPGGWTLSAADLLRIRWDSTPARETMYHIEHNGERAYHSLWTPKLGETVTESFFWLGDLWTMNYRLLKVIDE